MDKNNIVLLAVKFSQIIAFLVGVSLTTYNVFSFKIAKNGYYFNDDNQTWLAVGVFSLALAYVIKNWNKI